MKKGMALKKKVLFLGCNTDQVPYLLSARKLGFRLIATDKNPNAPGASIADKFYQASYTDIDELKRIVEQENFKPQDKVFTASSQFAYEGAAFIAKYTGAQYMSAEVVDICLDKHKFYNFIKRFNVPFPKTRLFNHGSNTKIDSYKAYFLKSDYGKSRHFCYRIVNGKIPPLPRKFSQYYRKTFLLQEEATGLHYRINFYSDNVSVFLNFSDLTFVALPSLGLEHKLIAARLSKVIGALGLKSYLVKFDLIINEYGWYILDIGLDPPFRFRLLCNHLGIDFEMAYTKYYLLGEKFALPSWPKIYKPVLISGGFKSGFAFTDLG